ncbi:hypothetical protein, partial [Actinokineospora sp.]|uniref:hypothetical protein n=1 Tax=Actinokineospora sp. TaxID=1872133 RepID=UPI004037EB6B
HHGWPIVIKPRAESSSAGVVIAHRPTDIQMPANAMVQAFHPGQVYKVDGVFNGSGFDIWATCRYLHNCLDFRSGSTLAVVQEDDPDTVARVGEFAVRALRALSAKPVVFHLEVFVDGDRCAFLEVGARVGGGETPFLWREVHGYDLMAAAFHLAVAEEPPPVPPNVHTGQITGELLIPAPAKRPCRVLEVTPMVGRVPGPYAEDLLGPGDILPDADAYYEHVGGRFRFRGTTSAEVEAAVEATARDFRVRAEPLTAAA